MHIAFFDSGLGGLSVAQELLKHPEFSKLQLDTLSYVADTEAYPYGNKNDAWLNERILNVLLASHTRLLPDMWVIACNTASTLVLETLRQYIKVPIIGVVPAIKPAALTSKSKVIGVLATPATVARNYTAQLIADHAPGCTVLLHGSETLVHESEKKLLGTQACEQTLRQAIEALIGQPAGDKIDTIVLGCTHYPLIKPELSKVVPHIQFWVDSGEAIARRVIALAEALPPNAPSSRINQQLHVQWCTTGATSSNNLFEYRESLTHWLLADYKINNVGNEIRSTTERLSVR